MTIRTSNPITTYIHIPKTAGQSFKDWINHSKVPVERGFEHGTLKAAQQQWGDLGTTFTFVRNPFDRLVSIYFFSQVQANSILASIVGTNTYNQSKQQLDRQRAMQANFEKGFDWWVHYLDENWNELYLNETFPFLQATLPQVAWFSGQEIDLVMKVENLSTEFKQLQQLFKSTFRLERLNTTKHDNYKTYYTASSIAIVEKMYKQDLEKFNYVY